MTGTPDIIPDGSLAPLTFDLDLNPASEYTTAMTYPKLKCYQGTPSTNPWRQSVKEPFTFSVRCSPTIPQVDLGDYTPD